MGKNTVAHDFWNNANPRIRVVCRNHACPRGPLASRFERNIIGTIRPFQLECRRRIVSTKTFHDITYSGGCHGQRRYVVVGIDFSIWGTAMNVMTQPETVLLDDGVQMRDRPQVHIDRSRDALLTDFGRATLDDRYLLPGESYQDLFARVASYYGDDAAHAQRLYDYISKMWFIDRKSTV